MSDKAVEVTPSTGSDHDAAASPVGHEHTAMARRAFKGVVSNWLQDRLDLLVIAGSAYAVNRLPVCVRGLQFIHERPLLGFLRPVADRLGLKLVRLSLFLLNCSNGALHRYLLRLNLDQVVQKLGDQSLSGDLVKLGLVKEPLHVRSDVGCVLGRRHHDANKRCEGEKGLYQDRLLLGVSEGDEGIGGRCERSPVPPESRLCISRNQGLGMTTSHETPLRAPAAAAVDAREPASPRILPFLRAGWQRLKVKHDRLNDSLIGDAIGLAGVIGTFLIFYSLTA